MAQLKVNLTTVLIAVIVVVVIFIIGYALFPPQSAGEKQRRTGIISQRLLVAVAIIAVLYVLLSS